MRWKTSMEIVLIIIHSPTNLIPRESHIAVFVLEFTRNFCYYLFFLAMAKDFCLPSQLFSVELSLLFKSTQYILGHREFDQIHFSLCVFSSIKYVFLFEKTFSLQTKKYFVCVSLTLAHKMYAKMPWRMDFGYGHVHARVQNAFK